MHLFPTNKHGSDEGADGVHGVVEQRRAVAHGAPVPQHARAAVQRLQRLQGARAVHLLYKHLCTYLYCVISVLKI